MDGLSVAASVVSIATAGIQISIKLVTLANQISTASERVTSIGNDVSLTSGILHQLGELMTEKAVGDGISIFSPGGLETTRTSAGVCQTVFREIEKQAGRASEQLRGISRLKGGKVELSKYEKAKWPFLQPGIESLRGDLREAKGTLMVMLQVATLALSKKMADFNASTTSNMIEQGDLIRAIISLHQSNEFMMSGEATIARKVSNVAQKGLLRLSGEKSSGSNPPTEPSDEPAMFERAPTRSVEASDCQNAGDLPPKPPIQSEIYELASDNTLVSSSSSTAAKPSSPHAPRMQLASSCDNNPLHDYQMELMLKEQQNKKCLLDARQKHEKTVCEGSNLKCGHENPALGGMDGPHSLISMFAQPSVDQCGKTENHRTLDNHALSDGEDPPSSTRELPNQTLQATSKLQPYEPKAALPSCLSECSSAQTPSASIDSGDIDSELRFFLMKPIVKDYFDKIELTWSLQNVKMQRLAIRKHVARLEEKGSPSVLDMLQTLHAFEQKMIDEQLDSKELESSLLSLTRTKTDVYHRDMTFKGVPGLQFVVEREMKRPKTLRLEGDYRPARASLALGLGESTYEDHEPSQEAFSMSPRNTAIDDIHRLQHFDSEEYLTGVTPPSFPRDTFEANSSQYTQNYAPSQTGKPTKAILYHSMSSPTGQILPDQMTEEVMSEMELSGDKAPTEVTQRVSNKIAIAKERIAKFQAPRKLSNITSVPVGDSPGRANFPSQLLGSRDTMANIESERRTEHIGDRQTKKSMQPAALTGQRRVEPFSAPADSAITQGEKEQFSQPTSHAPARGHAKIPSISPAKSEFRRHGKGELPIMSQASLGSSDAVLETAKCIRGDPPSPTPPLKRHGDSADGVRICNESLQPPTRSNHVPQDDDVSIVRNRFGSEPSSDASFFARRAKLPSDHAAAHHDPSPGSPPFHEFEYSDLRTGRFPLQVSYKHDGGDAPTSARKVSKGFVDRFKRRKKNYSAHPLDDVPADGETGLFAAAMGADEREGLAVAEGVDRAEMAVVEELLGRYTTLYD